MVKEVVIKAVMNYPGGETERDEIFVFLGVFDLFPVTGYADED